MSAPKALGAWYLHDLSQKQGLDLEAFVCISSLASHIGGTGVAYYCAANAFLDTLVRYRRSQGLPGLSYNMASLSDVGILADNLKARQIQIKSGVEFMSSFQVSGFPHNPFLVKCLTTLPFLLFNILCTYSLVLQPERHAASWSYV